MTDKPRPLTSIFRLPRIPIKNLFKADTQGFVSYSLTKREKSWEVKDATGCQLFWVELETERDTGSLAELLGIFGEQIAVLRREGPVSNKYVLAFTSSADAPEYNSITLSFSGTFPKRSVSIVLVAKGSEEQSSYTWDISGNSWNLKKEGSSKLLGNFDRTSEEKATVSFPQNTSPEEIAILVFAITFATYSSSI